MKEKINILLTSVGRRSYLVKYFQNAIAGEGLVHAANSSGISTGLAFADQSVITPLIYDDSYIHFLLNYCKENQIMAVIPLFDVDLPVLARNRLKFDKIGTRLIVSNLEILDVCNDKWKTYKFLKKNGFSTPLTYIDLNEALNAVKEGKLKFPVVIKPRWGMGSIAIYDAEEVEELCVLYKKSKRDIFSSYLKYESGMDIEHSVLIQEKINGQEYGIDNISDLDGNFCTTIVKQKLGMRSGETDCAKIVDSPKIKEMGKKLALQTKHIANMDIDLIARDEDIYILDMNARFGGGYPFSHMAGVDLPLAIVKWLRREIVEENLLIPKFGMVIQKDISMIRLERDCYERTEWK